MLEQQRATNGAFFENSIGDPSVGVVGDDHDSVDPTTNANRAPLKTRLGRWLKQAGMNAARDFDDETLDFETYRRFVLDKRDRNWEWRQIVSTLREAPLEPAPAGAALADAGDDLADAGDDLADAGDDLATIEAARRAFRESCRKELLESANRRPNTYHGGSK